MNNQPDTGNVTTYECGFCQNRFQKFIPWPDKFEFPQAEYEMWNKHTAICPFCYSMDRERMYRLYIERETDLLHSPRSVLHISSELGLRNWFINKHNIHYVGGDVTTENGMRQINIMSINYPDQMFDAVICSHVLEHVSDDLKAMKELHRVMKNDGWGIMQVPIALNLQKTNEDPNIVTPEHRFQAFGQEDRVRIYAKGDFVQRLESVGFTVNQIHFAQKYGIAEIMKYGLSQKDILYIVTKKTVSKGSDVPVVSDESNKVSWHYKLFIIWKNIVKKIGGIVKKDR